MVISTENHMGTTHREGGTLAHSALIGVHAILSLKEWRSTWKRRLKECKRQGW